MAPWKLPLVVAAIAMPIVAGFYVGGGGVGLGAGAMAAIAIVVVAIRQRPDGPIVPPAADSAGRHVLIVVAEGVEDPGDVARIVGAARIDGAAEREDEVRVLAPARIGFLDRWASDVEGARQRAQQRLVATVAALAKAGVSADARVGDEDVVQAVEDQLRSYPATDVVLVSGGEDASDAAVELRSRLQPKFHHVRLE